MAGGAAADGELRAALVAVLAAEAARVESQLARVEALDASAARVLLVVYTE